MANSCQTREYDKMLVNETRELKVIRLQSAALWQSIDNIAGMVAGCGNLRRPEI